jgi:response regulator of citrate/malate metabolism
VIIEINRSYVQRVPGFDVVGVALNGKEAIAATQHRAVDLVLLDFYLPDMSGLDVCHALRAARTPPVDIIAMTAARDNDTVRAAFAYGVVQYLVKPYNFATFHDKLRRYAAYRQALAGGQSASQLEIDQMLNTLRNSTNTALPKGLSPPTYELIVGVLRNADRPLTATEIAQTTHTSLTRNTARRYLDHLHKQDLVVLTIRYGTTGRPEHLYQWVRVGV